MSEMRMVDKIGGAGSKDHASVTANVQRMLGDDALWGVVVSGPGGPAGRVTQQALDMIEVFQQTGDTDPYFDDIQQRLEAHAEDHGPQAVRIADETVAGMRASLSRGPRQFGRVAMGPELYAAGLYTHLLNEAGRETRLFDPTFCILRDAYGAIDLAHSTPKLMRELKTFSPRVLTVVPGTPGFDPYKQRVVPVTPEVRGYSDPTCIVIGHALDQLLYAGGVRCRIIKDDVSGMLRMRPGIMGIQPALASRLSVVEGSALTAGGSEVVHSTVLELLQQSDVQLQVCSGESMAGGGTIIEHQRKIGPDEGPIAGIAFQEAVSYTVDDIRMEHRAGVAAKIMDYFGDSNVQLINVVTGDGVVRAYVAAAHHRAVQDVLPQLFQAAYGDTFTLEGAGETDAFSIVTLVGEGMKEENSKSRGSSVAHVQLDAEVTIPNQALGGEIVTGPSWASPKQNAVYVTVPTGDVERYAATAYTHFFQ